MATARWSRSSGASDPLREGLTDERATDAMLFLASPGAYRTLVDDRGWTHAEWVAWTSRVLAEQLFDATSPPRAPATCG